jgi:hypothetical protein
MGFMNIPLLQCAYDEVIRNNGLIELTMCLRNEKAIKKDRVQQLFENLPLWEKVRQANGHATYKNGLTGIVIGLQAHGNNEIWGQHADSLLQAVQEHMNILHNIVFQFKPRGWRHNQPNYPASLHRYVQWKAGLAVK